MLEGWWKVQSQVRSFTVVGHRPSVSNLKSRLDLDFNQQTWVSSCRRKHGLDQWLVNVALSAGYTHRCDRGLYGDNLSHRDGGLRDGEHRGDTACVDNHDGRSGSINAGICTTTARTTSSGSAAFLATSAASDAAGT